MTGLSHGFDAAFPPAAAYPGCQVVAGYIGGNTPHVWSLAEWLRFSSLRQIPIWVANLNPGAASGTAQGQAAAAAAHALGWKDHAANPRAIVLDMETWINPGFVTSFAQAVHAAGYITWVYGSASTVIHDPACGGYWAASWDGIETLENMPNVVGHQYKADVSYQGTQVDLSVWAGSAWDHMGYGPRRHVG